MISTIKESMWKQFGASIDMLENAIAMCPSEFWNTEQKFWYSSYHCLFWLDYCLTIEPQQFNPPSGYSLSEFNSTFELPARAYSKKELLTYVEHCRKKCHHLLFNLTEEMVVQRWVNEYKNYSILEILLYNMRHVQHHVAQLNLILRQGIHQAPGWVSQTKDTI
jgi:DinB superfamily